MRILLIAVLLAGCAPGPSEPEVRRLPQHYEQCRVQPELDWC